MVVIFYTLVLTRDKLFKAGLLSFSFLSSGALILLASLFLLPYEMLKDLFWSGLLYILVLLFIYIGWQLRVIEIVGKEFLERHMGAQIFKEYGLQMSNIKYITAEKREYFDQIKYTKPEFNAFI